MSGYSGGGGGGTWGSITGTLSSQSDLNTALGNKAAASIFTWGPATGTSVSISGAATSYSCPYSLTFNTTEVNRQIMVPQGGTLFNLVVKTSGTQGSDGTMICMLRVNGVNSALTFTIATNAAGGLFHDITHTVAVSEGDLIGLQVINAASTPSAILFWGVSFK